jgi:hypothetical protein
MYVCPLLLPLTSASVLIVKPSELNVKVLPLASKPELFGCKKFVPLLIESHKVQLPKASTFLTKTNLGSKPVFTVTADVPPS